MEYNVKNVIERLQKYQKENADPMIDDDTLLELAKASVKVNCIDNHVESLELLINDCERWMRTKIKQGIDFGGHWYWLYKKISEGDYKINKSNVAMALGVKRPTIDKWIKEGIIGVSYGHGKEVLIDLTELHRVLLIISKARHKQSKYYNNTIQ